MLDVDQWRAPELYELSLSELDPALFIDPHKEVEYCDEHGIVIDRFSNGATLMTMPYIAQGHVDAWIKINFPQGSYFDASGKTGALHISEHSIAKKPYETAWETKAIFKGSTSPSQIEFNIHGAANPFVRELGVWGVLPVLFDSLAYPGIPNAEMDYRVHNESGVLINERLGYIASHDFQVRSAILDMTLGDENPFRLSSLGIVNELQSLTAKDIVKTAEETYIPDGMVVSALASQHKIPVQAALHQELQELIQTFPRSEQKRRRIKPAYFEKTNAAFSPGSITEYDTHISNNLVTISLLWNVTCPPYSKEKYSLVSTFDFAGKNLFHLTRGNDNISYSPRVEVYSPGHFSQICYAQITVEKRGDIRQYALAMRDKLFPAIFNLTTTQDIESYLRQESLYRKAIPLSVEERFMLAQAGLENFGKMINVDEVIRRQSESQPKDFLHWIKYLSSIPPALCLVGDLS